MKWIFHCEIIFFVVANAEGFVALQTYDGKRERYGGMRECDIDGE